MTWNELQFGILLGFAGFGAFMLMEMVRGHVKWK